MTQQGTQAEGSQAFGEGVLQQIPSGGHLSKPMRDEQDEAPHLTIPGALEIPGSHS